MKDSRRKYTQKALREIVANGWATDITWVSFDEGQALREKEGYFTQTGYASGIYGCNGALLVGHNTGEWYVIHKRSSALFQFV